jgi:hypothetical protein
MLCGAAISNINSNPHLTEALSLSKPNFTTRTAIMSVQVLSPSLTRSERPSWLTSLPRTSSSRLVNPTSTTKIDISSSPSCITTFPVRLHVDEPQVTLGAHAARKTWLDIVSSSDDTELRPHSAGPHGNFFAITWPYGRTERVKLATEIIETLWMYDGQSEQHVHRNEDIEVTNR